MNVIQKIKQARVAKGMTQVELAELTGISQPYLSALESGHIDRPRPETTRKLCAALGLVYIDEDVQPSQ